MLYRYGYREQCYHQLKKITESYIYHDRLGTPRKIGEVLKLLFVIYQIISNEAFVMFQFKIRH